MSKRKNYPGSIRQREGYFQVRLCVETKYHNFRVEGTDRVEAETFARDKYNELLRGPEREAEPVPATRRSRLRR